MNRISPEYFRDTILTGTFFEKKSISIVIFLAYMSDFRVNCINSIHPDDISLDMTGLNLAGEN